MENFIIDLSVILVGAALLSFLAVVFKQPIILAYILCGIFVGPWGIGWVNNVHFVEEIAHLGITLLLFLAGLNLHPQKLIRIFRKTLFVVIAGSLFSFVLAYLFAKLFGFTPLECLIIGLSLMFSSTILTVKLLPTTDLHHAHMGAVCIGVLILQDLLAIAVLAFTRCLQTPEDAVIRFLVLSLKLVAFLGLLFLFEYYVLRRIMLFVERLHELIFVLGLAWCFGLASISHQMGLFYETGAFFAGVVMARHPIAVFISEKLKPLRDFFLVLFFFTLGAKLDLFIMMDILIPAVVIAVLFVILKPVVFYVAINKSGESSSFAKEAGLRLGQLSEFSLLIAILALEMGLISERASQLIQFVTILSFIISSYLIVNKYKTPIGMREGLIKD